MKQRLRRLVLLLIVVLATLLGTTGCLTPHVGMGVNVGMNDGKLKLYPNVNVGFHGHL